MFERKALAVTGLNEACQEVRADKRFSIVKKGSELVLATEGGIQ